MSIRGPNTKAFEKLPLDDPTDFEKLYEILDLSYSQLSNRLRPGSYSSSGFLGMNEGYEIVVTEDNKILNKLGISHQQFGTFLRDLLEGKIGENVMEDHRSLRSWIGFNRAGFRYNITKISYAGSLLCPFTRTIPEGASFDYEIFRYNDPEHSSLFRSIGYKFKKVFRGEEKKIIAGSLPYYIMNFGFFQGHEVKYRLNPLEVLNFFKISDEELTQIIE